MLYDIWITDGHYVKGTKLGQDTDVAKAYTTAVAALRKTQADTKFSRDIDKKTREVWIENPEGQPQGVLEPVPETS